METTPIRPAAFQPAPRMKLGSIVLLVALMHAIIIAGFFLHFSWQLGDDNEGQAELGQTGIVIPVTLESATETAAETPAEPSSSNEPSNEPTAEPAAEQSATTDTPKTPAPASESEPTPTPTPDPAPATSETTQEISSKSTPNSEQTTNAPTIVPEITLEAARPLDQTLSPPPSTLSSDPTAPAVVPTQAPTPASISTPAPKPKPTPTPTPTPASSPNKPGPRLDSPSVESKASISSGASGSTSPAPIDITQAVTEARIDPNYLHRPDPAYPSLSKRRQEQGMVLLRVSLDARGAVTSINVERTSGFDRLDQAALEAVAQWRFLPAKRGQEPIPSTVQVPIEFKYQP